jgi:hypothetical protein
MEPDKVQGWYRDPFGVHGDRYFSEGRPTKLVRDGGVEAYDEPPDKPFVAAGLIPAESPQEGGYGGSDLRRADDAERDGGSSDLRRADEASLHGPYSTDEARRAAMDSVTQTWPPF